MEIFTSLVPASFQLMEGIYLPKLHKWNTHACLRYCCMHYLDNSGLRKKVKNEIPLKILPKHQNSKSEHISLMKYSKGSAFSEQAKEPQ